MNQRQQVNKRGVGRGRKRKPLAQVIVREGISSATPHTCAMKWKAVVEPVHLCMDGEEQNKGYMLVPTRLSERRSGLLRSR